MEEQKSVEEITKTMVQKGIVFGHKKSKTHPKMRQHVVGNRNEIELMNPESSWESVASAAAFLREKAKEGFLMLLVGTKPAAKAVIIKTAEEFNFPYVVSRWLGGTITNFSVIKKRIDYYLRLQGKIEKGELEKYTKKEQYKMKEEAKKLSGFFDGLCGMKRVPDALFVIDPETHKTAVREAKKLNIPVIAIMDTNDDPSFVDVPIIANDHSRESIDWVIEELKKSLVKFSEKTE